MFWFRLAALWGCTVREAQQRCDAAEFAEWMAYYSVEPFGEEPANYRAASIGLAIAQFNSIGAKTRQLKLDDFLLKFGKPQRKRPTMSAEEIKASLMLFGKLHNEVLASRRGKPSQPLHH